MSYNSALYYNAPYYGSRRHRRQRRLQAIAPWLLFFVIANLFALMLVTPWVR